MEDPTKDVAYALVRVLNAPTPEAQLDAVKQYFTPDACLIHPLCCIESSPTSRERVIRAIAFLRIVASGCEARIRRQAFNDVKGKMSLELDMTPSVLGLQRISRAFGWEMPTVPVHVFLGIVRDGGGIAREWRVRKVEVVVQPIDVFNAVGLGWLGRLIYHFVWVFMTAVVLLGELGHAWSTSEVSLLAGCLNVVKDGWNIVVVAPMAAAWATVVWARGALGKAVGKAVGEVRRENAGLVFFLQHGWRIVLRRMIQQLMGH